MIEKEFKTRITFEEYVKLRSSYKFNYKDIINRYFDTPNFEIAKSGDTLRMRTTTEEDGERKHEVTFKQKISDNTFAEYNSFITDETYFEWVKNNTNPAPYIFTLVGLNDLDFIATAVTERFEVKLNHGTLTLDNVIMLGNNKQMSYYELEFECVPGQSEDGFDEFMRILEHNKITYIPSGSKYVNLVKELF